MAGCQVLQRQPGFLTLATALVIMFAPDISGERWLFLALLGASVILWAFAALLYAGIPEVAGSTEEAVTPLTRRYDR